jgi:hypothetical protein
MHRQQHTEKSWLATWLARSHQSLVITFLLLLNGILRPEYRTGIEDTP